MKCTLISAFLLTVVAIGSAEQAIDISIEFENRKIEALQAYLEANPDAKDQDTALKILVGSFTELGDFKPIPDLLIRRYDLMPKTDEINLQLLIGEITSPLLEACITTGQRDKAKAFITRVKFDHADSPAAEQLTGILDRLAADLYLPGVGDKMEFAFTGLQGEEVDLGSMTDKVILVDFWATWCAPCIAALPDLLSTYETYHEQGFEVIGISLDENRGELASFVEENQIPWPQYFDAKGGDNELAQRFGIRKIPATFLVGKGGRIVAADLHGEELAEAIEKELER